MADYQGRIELKPVRLANPQRIDDHPVVGEELDEVAAAEGRRVLVLSPAHQAEIDPLDLVGEARNLVLAERQIEILGEGFDERHY